MKKLFTLFAFLAVFLGANAKTIIDAEVDFSKYSDISEWNFPHSWGGSEEARSRLSIVDGCLHYESTQATTQSWDAQFFPIGGVDAEVDVTYTLHFKIKGDHTGNVSMLGFGLTPYGQFTITDSWVEGTVDYTATNNDGNILMQCGDWVGSWDIAYLKITHEGKEEAPVTWDELITDDGTPEGTKMGTAETPWGDRANTLFTDIENTIYVCAWGKQKGTNLNEQGGSDPFPATIEVDPDNADNHVFVVHGAVADTEGDASSWDNQFWIMSTKELKVGSQYKFSFRYKASEAAHVGTQMHSAQPSDYLHYVAIGDVDFTTEWQTFEAKVTIPTPQNDRPIYSIAFNLNSQNKNAVDFYFDDLSISEVHVEHGFFVTATNTTTGVPEYDFATATKFEVDPLDESLVVATVGSSSSWVNEVMISTVRGNDRSYKASTIKVNGIILGNDYDEDWPFYEDKANTKIGLPAQGVWQISIDAGAKQINFLQLEGDPLKNPTAIITNESVLVIEGVERDDLSDTFENEERTGREEEGGAGETWDNQFFIVANRVLKPEEVTIIEFDCVATNATTSSTGTHAMPSSDSYRKNAFGDVPFSTTEEHFKAEYTVPASDWGGTAITDAQAISFDMAIFKGANTYTIKNVKWYLKAESLNAKGQTLENLINETGTDNFYWKIGAGNSIVPYGTDPTGIINIINGTITGSDVIYNLSGQRVTKDYKGVVIMNGRKVVNK
jgi:hypothetical protein